MDTIRQPAVAGLFYPADPVELRAMLNEFLTRARTDEPAPRAMILPHAGYIYSGPVAATGYARLLNSPGLYSRVVLLGPAHRVAFSGLAATSATAFATPLGQIPVDQEANRRLADLPQVHMLDEAQRLEHSLEVHLPFLQLTLGHFTLVPLVVGDATAEEVCEVLEREASLPGTLLVISSDLSHYHDYVTAMRMDKATSGHIEALDYAGIGYGQACGRNPISGLLLYAKRHTLTAETIDLRNSGDTAGPRDQVVGYGTYVFN
jgi:AmmeMemoRadiSam system protein B